MTGKDKKKQWLTITIHAIHETSCMEEEKEQI
jgi:hypothetical protein